MVGIVVGRQTARGMEFDLGMVLTVGVGGNNAHLCTFSPARGEGTRFDYLPMRVIEVNWTRVRFDVIGCQLAACRLPCRVGRAESGLDDSRIGVSPQSLHRSDTSIACKVDRGERRCCRFALDSNSSQRRRRDSETQQEVQCEGSHGCVAPDDLMT